MARTFTIGPKSPRDWANNYEANQAELTEAFKLVQPETHWKDPIDKVVPSQTDLALIAEAVIHFTATVPTFEPVPGGYRVRAAGYLAGPAGRY